MWPWGSRCTETPPPNPAPTLAARSSQPRLRNCPPGPTRTSSWAERVRPEAAWGTEAQPRALAGSPPGPGLCWARPSLSPPPSLTCRLHRREAPSMPRDPPSVRSLLVSGPGSDQRGAGLPLFHRQRNQETRVLSGRVAHWGHSWSGRFLPTPDPHSLLYSGAQSATSGPPWVPGALMWEAGQNYFHKILRLYLLLAVFSATLGLSRAVWVETAWHEPRNRQGDPAVSS